MAEMSPLRRRMKPVGKPDAGKLHVPSRVVLEFVDASSGDTRLSDHVARSMM
jgi:hypothetical protein